MRKVISDIELQNKIKESIELLCGTVKKTLGPKGNNVIINHSNFTPFITNDGVTIAQNIESDDEITGAILEIIKEASIKTDEEVGDGTTTTLVLLETLYKESLEYVNKGTHPVVLKKELEIVLNEILEDLQKLKKKSIQEKEKYIAKIAANDEELGMLAYKTFQKVKNKNAITIKEGNKTEIKLIKGYTLETNLASLYFLKEKNKIDYTDALVLLISGTLRETEMIAVILNDVKKYNKKLVVIANEYEEYVVQEIVSLCLNFDLNCCLLTFSEFGLKEQMIRRDIEIIIDAKNMEDSQLNMKLGNISHLVIEKEKIRMDFKGSERTQDYIKLLKKQKEQIKDEFEQDFYQKRLAMFSYGIAEIDLYAPTKTEFQEKKMRLTDALCAVSVAQKGILIGGGVSLLQIAKCLENKNNATQIWKKTLEKPFEQIFSNAGLDAKLILNQLKEQNFQKVYNLNTNKWEENKNTVVIDSFLVVHNSLINAFSIASMLLITTSLVVNEHSNYLNKVDNYLEI